MQSTVLIPIHWTFIKSKTIEVEYFSFVYDLTKDIYPKTKTLQTHNSLFSTLYIGNYIQNKPPIEHNKCLIPHLPQNFYKLNDWFGYRIIIEFDLNLL